MPRHLLTPEGHGSSFLDSLLLGNGSLGAALTGTAGAAHLDLNLDTLWSGGPLEPPSTIAPEVLERVRSLVADRDFLAADDAATGLHSSGWTQAFQPLGRVSWRWSDADGQTERELDLARGIATHRVVGAESTSLLRAFVSAPDQVLVAVADTGRPGTDELELTSPHAVEVDRWDTDSARWWRMTGRVPAHVLPSYEKAGSSRPAIVYADDQPDDAGLVTAGMGFALVVAVADLGDRRLLVASAESGFRGWDQRPSADVAALAETSQARVARALGTAEETLLERHVADHGALFERVDLDLSESARPEAPRAQDPATAELYFDLGRYLLIASSRRGTQAATLQGIWNVDVRPAWSSNYTTNINVEMNYWLAESTALSDLHEPLFTLTRELAQAGRAQARAVYGARGAVVHHNTDLWRFTAAVNGDPQWSNWPSGLPWLAAHLGDHLDFAWDGELAHDLALPVHEAVCAFALDMLVPDGDGGLVVSPSTSPEHRFAHDGGFAAVSAGATMDQELVLQAFTRLLDLAARTGAGDDVLLEQVRQALPRVRRPAIGSDGALLEWADERDPREPGHRHVSHLYGVYPGTRITPSRAPHELEAAGIALRRRLANGGGHTGWSRAWTIGLAARLGDPALAETSIVALLEEQSSSTLMDLHPMGSGAVFQIDGNFGAAAGIAELLVQSHDEAIALLPALPPGWPTGRVRGLRARGGHRVDLAWRDHDLERAVIDSAGGAVVVEVAEVDEVTVRSSSGGEVAITSTPGAPGRRRHGWDGPADRYEIERAAAPRPVTPTR